MNISVLRTSLVPRTTYPVKFKISQKSAGLLLPNSFSREKNHRKKLRKVDYFEKLFERQRNQNVTTHVSLCGHFCDAQLKKF